MEFYSPATATKMALLFNHPLLFTGDYVFLEEATAGRKHAQVCKLVKFIKVLIEDR